MSGFYFFQSRAKVQLVCAFFIVLSIVLLLVHQTKKVYQDELVDRTEKLQQLVSREIRLLHQSGKKYNLMEESDGQSIFDNNAECTLDYMNTNKIPQDHPCVIETIRKNYLNKPSPPDVPLKLDKEGDHDRSPGQTGVIFRLLKNQTKGFFVECGALNGEFMSNTIDLERKYNWGGILIEANPETFKKLISHNRKAWTLPVCLSLEPFPTQVTFQMKVGDPGHSHIEGAAKTLQKPGIPGVDPDLVTVQCFPFYSILLAVGRTQVDFFSLDVEGHELKILKTIPWHKVDIKSLTVEWDHIPEGQEALIRFMEGSGFIKIGAFDFLWSRDVIFIKDLINTH
ncbi:protein Star-like [Daphnia carinata]|uniref:protein Star-like n=1 Tax=Daphnia carinata TaxID=120202 RepID=UPI00257C759B|nr:protein Star-like [Daphnia carinata]